MSFSKKLRQFVDTVNQKINDFNYIDKDRPNRVANNVFKIHRKEKETILTPNELAEAIEFYQKLEQGNHSTPGINRNGKGEVENLPEHFLSFDYDSQAFFLLGILKAKEMFYKKDNLK